MAVQATPYRLVGLQLINLLRTEAIDRGISAGAVHPIRRFVNIAILTS